MAKETKDIRAGSDLDERISVEVMQLVPCTNQIHASPSMRHACFAQPDSSDEGASARAYSVDLNDAWLVVEKLRERGLIVVISTPSPGNKMWDVRGWNDQTNDNRFIAHAETAPLAICLAALSAIRSTEDPDAEC